MKGYFLDNRKSFPKTHNWNLKKSHLWSIFHRSMYEKSQYPSWRISYNIHHGEYHTISIMENIIQYHQSLRKSVVKNCKFQQKKASKNYILSGHAIGHCECWQRLNRGVIFAWILWPTDRLPTNKALELIVLNATMLCFKEPAPAASRNPLANARKTRIVKWLNADDAVSNISKINE